MVKNKSFVFCSNQSEIIKNQLDSDEELSPDMVFAWRERKNLWVVIASGLVATAMKARGVTKFPIPALARANKKKRG